ncbi:alpha/beta hydrolase [Microvirga antarctica]|uniref:alpha/beta hydrolase n=1 Tax=Microvirga antarctica TaxID=2819233 RepID=UPI001B314541|nr:alpha/beta hydrolase [Microvirga antarctica]
MPARIIRFATRLSVILIVICLTLLAVRAYDSQRGAALEPWHTYVPHELSVAELDRSDWTGYREAEAKIFADIRAKVTQKLDVEERVSFNRYFEGSPVYPGHFAQDWNRSYELEPVGPSQGAVVLLHGLTDSPYSLRHIANHYRERGFLAVGIRLPAHGTVPGALTDVEWEDWVAATRLAVREARARVGNSVPLHIVGFSNGGALAMKYALDALSDGTLAKPDRIVLISPMIGVTSFARFAGLAALPAILPAFAKAAWLSILPEFNPFKYNSFPVNGARQSHRLTAALQDSILRAARDGQLERLPPVLTFQSTMDFTVSTRAVISALYLQLPANDSEIVLFDLNRSAKFGPLFRATSDTFLSRLLPEAPRRFRTSVVTNAAPDTGEVVARIVDAGTTAENIEDLRLAYPRDVFSLSHVALPFPVSDPLYGLDPEGTETFGVSLGSIAPRGERGALIVDMDTLLRLSSNPFFAFLITRIDAAIDQSLKGSADKR